MTHLELQLALTVLRRHEWAYRDDGKLLCWSCRSRGTGENARAPGWVRIRLDRSQV